MQKTWSSCQHVDGCPQPERHYYGVELTLPGHQGTQGKEDDIGVQLDNCGGDVPSIPAGFESR